MMEEHPDRAHYRLIADQLRHRIISQRLEAGSSLPSESQLREEFGVSRTTIRRALDLLRAEGLVVREPGVGTRVVDLVMLWPGDRLTSSGPVWVTRVDGATEVYPAGTVFECA
jgi:DNA-binding GntR family transcriptional regulator